MITAAQARKISEQTVHWGIKDILYIEEEILSCAKGNSKDVEFSYIFSKELKTYLKDVGYKISEYVNGVGNLITKISW